MKEKNFEKYDPNSLALDNGKVFGLPFEYEDSPIVILPIPWDVTVSYGNGTSNGPKAILEASRQVDLYDNDHNLAWQVGFYMLEEDPKIASLNKTHRKIAEECINFLEQGGDISKSKELNSKIQTVNKASENIRKIVKESTSKQLQNNKIVGLLGGDHSTPLGLFDALAEKYSEFGVLQIDAHMDLREAYEGFTYSHASIFYNALKSKSITKLVQVGIRDYCQAEIEEAHSQGQRVEIFYDRDLKSSQFTGTSWDNICSKIISNLPSNVHISFDIDGLDPKLCPNTGTPVPGGLEYEQVLHLFRRLVASGRKIISFDLNEVSIGDGTSDWDANVGARILWKLCVYTAISNNLSPL
jgi:agmatinase